jgi:hypothetical protein
VKGRKCLDASAYGVIEERHIMIGRARDPQSKWLQKYPELQVLGGV